MVTIDFSLPRIRHEKVIDKSATQFIYAVTIFLNVLVVLFFLFVGVGLSGFFPSRLGVWVLFVFLVWVVLLLWLGWGKQGLISVFDMDAMLGWTDEDGAYVSEDTAQLHGIQYYGDP